MILIDAPCTHCGFSKVDIFMDEIENDHSQKDHVCSACGKSNLITVSIIDPEGLPF